MATTIINPPTVALSGATTQKETLYLSAAGTVVTGTILGRLTANSKLTPYVSGASDGSQIPVAVALETRVYTAAGDSVVDALVFGPVVQSALVIQAGGTPDKILLDKLRDYGVVAVPVAEPNSLVNL